MSIFDIGEPRGSSLHPNSPDFDEGPVDRLAELADEIRKELRGKADECLGLLCDKMLDGRLMLSLLAGDHAEFGRLCSKLLDEAIKEEAERLADERLEREVEDSRAAYADYLSDRGEF